MINLCIAKSNISLPNGWRYPTERELNDSQRIQSNNRYAKVRADFNADSILDLALLLKRGVTEGFWVSISNKGSESKWILLDTIQGLISNRYNPLFMGIEIIKPGTYRYMCFDSDSTCEMIEIEKRKQITITKPSIEYFMFESASSIFFWNDEDKQFIRIWISD